MRVNLTVLDIRTARCITIVKVQMRMNTRAWFWILLTLSSYAIAQTVATNTLAGVEAVRVVSQLPKGMRQADVIEVLQRNGLPDVHVAPCVQTTAFQRYGLADGSQLYVGYAVMMSLTNRSFEYQLANARLKEARIESNGVPVLSIVLTNAP
jgi:hypothetical protein